MTVVESRIPEDGTTLWSDPNLYRFKSSKKSEKPQHRDAAFYMSTRKKMPVLLKDLNKSPLHVHKGEVSKNAVVEQEVGYF